MTITTTNKPAWYQQTLEAIQQGMHLALEGLQSAAAAYVSAIDRDPAFRDFAADEDPSIPGGIWRDLERIGRGQLDPRIATGAPYGNRLRFMPISEQRRALDGTIALLTSTGDTLQVKIDSLMPEQAAQVFARDGIRDLPGQRAWIESRASAEAVKAKPVKNAVEIDRKRRCIVVNGHRMHATELADYLRKISE